VLISIVLGVGLLAALPAGASAITVAIQNGTLVITGDSVPNTVGIDTVTLPGAEPDIVIGDLSAGIPDPIPPDCARIDQDDIRCPAKVIGVIGNLGAGNDVLGVGSHFTYPPMASASSRLAFTAADSELPTVRMQFGPGADRGSDQSVANDFWNGGTGKDRLASGPSNDVVKGGAQNDIIDCGTGKRDVGVGGPGKRDLGIHCESVRH
jgi:Ca2+-binding RTX toxin-like protein